MEVRMMTSRSSMCTCSRLVNMLAVLCVVAIDAHSKEGVLALITGEPTYGIYDYTHHHVPLPPDVPDNTDLSGCIHLQNDIESANDTSSSCRFVFKKPRSAFHTDVGEFKVVELGEEHLMQRRKMAVGLLTMEPNALLLPQYLNGPSVFYVHRGLANLWYLEEEKQKSKALAAGELQAISGGTPFYILNAQSNENLQIIVLVDLSDMPKHGTLQCFYIAGGTYPTTVASGFTEDVLAAAFKVTTQKARDLFSSQDKGPIVNATELQVEDVAAFTGEFSNKYPYISKKKERHYQLLDEKHTFHNQNGWSVAMSRKRYKGLEEADVGMFAVGLKSGCMVAPHWNPSMTAIGIATHGRGYIQVAGSNGSTIVDMDLQPGSVFVVPRYYPSSQIAANDLDFEFVGFTTSSHPMQPHFLAGANSVFQSMDKNVLSKAFNVAEAYIGDVLGAQPDEVILTTERAKWMR